MLILIRKQPPLFKQSKHTKHINKTNKVEETYNVRWGKHTHGGNIKIM